LISLEFSAANRKIPRSPISGLLLGEDLAIGN
jgi:hypothetical protein